MKNRSSVSPPQAIPFSRAPRPTREILPASWVGPNFVAAMTLQQTSAYRLASSPLAWLERFGDELLLSYKLPAARDALQAELTGRLADYGLGYRRLWGKFLARAAEERLAPVLLAGLENAPLNGETQEAGLKFGLDFAAGYSAGLFIDQRENRAELARLLNHRVGARLLNTFAYTCSFSVVAAKLGAETLSIDLSRKSLTRGEENFSRNGLDASARHRFLADDVLTALPRLAKHGERFDFIVLDPPTFSRNQKGRPFQAERDFGRLVELALEVAAPGAHLLLSTNCTALRKRDLEKAGRLALRLSKRTGRFYQTPALPDIPVEQAPATLWMEIS